MDELSDYLTLVQMAQAAPSQLSPHCLWRWCRQGVKSRAGERIRLKHVRIGGKILTKIEWVEEFGLRLAEADAEHFDLNEHELSTPKVARLRKHGEAQRQAHLENIERELEEAGL